MKLLFSVNRYDYEGDLVDECVLLHIGNISIEFENVEKLEEFADQIKKMLPEIKETVR